MRHASSRRLKAVALLISEGRIWGTGGAARTIPFGGSKASMVAVLALLMPPKPFPTPSARTGSTAGSPGVCVKESFVLMACWGVAWALNTAGVLRDGSSFTTSHVLFKEKVRNTGVYVSKNYCVLFDMLILGTAKTISIYMEKSCTT